MSDLRPEAQRAALVAKLKKLTKDELRVYCDGVLSAAALYGPTELVAALTEVIHGSPKVAARIIDLRAPRPRPTRKGVGGRKGLRDADGNVLCWECGRIVPRTRRAGRPKERHDVCPVRELVAA